MSVITKLVIPDGAEPITTDLEGWKPVAGTPSMKTYMLHTSQQGIITGLWEATAGTYHVIYSKYEFISLLQGKIVITPDGGDPVVVQAGDAFAVEATFVGTWEILEDVKKYFLIAPKAV